ncbi:MAG: T9SS type A sorting domain-containing protein [Bacteroidales bacterium]|nr:T9SS type A sorting domain-containing protein [Bacteroidales bacterium]
MNKEYNALRQLVKTVRDTNEINVADLPQGVYLVRIVDAEGIIYTNKITIQ